MDNIILLKKIKDLEFILERTKIKDWKSVQDIVRAGLAPKFFNIGDQFVAEFDGEPFVWDVIGIDHDIPTDKGLTHSLTIQAHDCLLNCQFDRAQALWHAEDELPPGEQIFTQDGSLIQYTFTTTEPIPEGGQVILSMDEYLPTSVTTLAADRVTVIESGLPVVEAEPGDDTLHNINVRTRVRYGSNNYTESAIRQWLNSEDETFVWEPQTPFDRPSTAAPYTGGGFLHRLDPELVAVLGAVDKQVARNTVTDGGGQDLFSDKVFLLSRVEVYGGTEGETSGEAPYPYYESLASSPTTGALDGRIKYLGASARHWWLRSPHPAIAGIPRTVNADGYVSSSGALSSSGAAPACTII